MTALNDIVPSGVVTGDDLLVRSLFFVKGGDVNEVVCINYGGEASLTKNRRPRSRPKYQQLAVDVDKS
jgi:hypothetical protein